MFFDSDLLMSALRALTPILLAALGGALCERAGVFNIGLEGMMLMGCFTSVATSWFTGSAWLGVLAAALAAAAYSLILAVGAVTLRGDAVVLGIAMNLLAVGLTSFLLRTVFGVQGTFDDPSLAGLPLVGGFTPSPIWRSSRSRWPRCCCPGMCGGCGCAGSARHRTRRPRSG